MDEQEKKIKEEEAIKQFGYNVYSLDEYNYNLPEELIAQVPSERRDESRLLVLNRKDESLVDKRFSDIYDYLQKGDVLVRNNTKVIPSRLLGRKKETGAHIEALLLRPIPGQKDVYQALCGNAKVIKVGTHLAFGKNDELQAECLEVQEEGLRILKLSYSGNFYEVLDEVGKMPLPPYIHNQEGKNDRYQTVYAKVEGSSAAPTAGFHFSEELNSRLLSKGVEIEEVTLHVGLGTFRPVKENNILDHKMHSEFYNMNQDVADRLNLAKKEGRRIIAVGTTSVRTLETIYYKFNEFKADSGDTSLFIYPGFKYEAVDALITNFHLPKSTLLMLVSAFASREYILKAYEHAIEERYHFFSFGDAMFIQ